MTAVFVLRHPQTTWNVAERYQGRLESPLSAVGERQCRSAARGFEDRRLAAVYSSPLGRSLALGSAIADVAESPLVVDHRLTEIGQGPWEGLYRAEIRSRFPALAKQWYERPDTVRFPGGESLEDVRFRSQSVLSDIFRLYPNEDVCVVTHSVVAQVFAAMALGLDLRHLHRITISNAAVTTLAGASAPGRLITLNATAAVQEAPMAATRVKTDRGRIAS